MILRDRFAVFAGRNAVNALEGAAEGRIGKISHHFADIGDGVVAAFDVFGCRFQTAGFQHFDEAGIVDLPTGLVDLLDRYVQCGGDILSGDFRRREILLQVGFYALAQLLQIGILRLLDRLAYFRADGGNLRHNGLRRHNGHGAVQFRHPRNGPRGYGGVLQLGQHLIDRAHNVAGQQERGRGGVVGRNVIGRPDAVHAATPASLPAFR